MAGFFAINNDSEFSMSSVYFDAIVNYSKLYMEKLSASLTHDIYEPIEEAGMFVIGLTETSSSDFNLVYKALDQGYRSCIDEGQCGNLDQSFYDDVMGMWREILQAMEKDERYSVD